MRNVGSRNLTIDYHDDEPTTAGLTNCSRPRQSYFVHHVVLYCSLDVAIIDRSTSS